MFGRHAGDIPIWNRFTDYFKNFEDDVPEGIDRTFNFRDREGAG